MPEFIIRAEETDLFKHYKELILFLCRKERRMKTINVMGVKFTIKEVDVVCKENPRRGDYDYLTATITLDKNMPTDMKNNTLMHEILHGLFDLLGMDELADDEQKVQVLATALYQVFSTQEVFYKND